VLLHYDYHTKRDPGESQIVERKATLLKSPSMPSKTVSYAVNSKGIRDYLPSVGNVAQSQTAVVSQVSCVALLILLHPHLFFLYSFFLYLLWTKDSVLGKSICLPFFTFYL
jgi:hypothetical protein